MTSNDFNSEEAKKFLVEREAKEKQDQEKERKKLLKEVISLLKEEFKNTQVEVYLVGSIIRPFSFSSRSDVDVVLKNYKGDRFDFWAKLEKKIGRDVEIISFETCPFQQIVVKDGFRVL